jgi:hypothetical protein
MENTHIKLNTEEGLIDCSDLFFDELNLSNVYLEMSKKKIKVKILKENKIFEE